MELNLVCKTPSGFKDAERIVSGIRRQQADQEKEAARLSELTLTKQKQYDELCARVGEIALEQGQLGAEVAQRNKLVSAARDLVALAAPIVSGRLANWIAVDREFTRTEAFLTSQTSQLKKRRDKLEQVKLSREFLSNGIEKQQIVITKIDEKTDDLKKRLVRLQQEETLVSRSSSIKQEAAMLAKNFATMSENLLIQQEQQLANSRLQRDQLHGKVEHLKAALKDVNQANGQLRSCLSILDKCSTQIFLQNRYNAIKKVINESATTYIRNVELQKSQQEEAQSATFKRLVNRQQLALEDIKKLEETCKDLRRSIRSNEEKKIAEEQAKRKEEEKRRSVRAIENQRTQKCTQIKLTETGSKREQSSTYFHDLQPKDWKESDMVSSRYTSAHAHQRETDCKVFDSKSLSKKHPGPVSIVSPASSTEIVFKGPKGKSFPGRKSRRILSYESGSGSADRRPTATTNDTGKKPKKLQRSESHFRDLIRQPKAKPFSTLEEKKTRTYSIPQDTPDSLLGNFTMRKSSQPRSAKDSKNGILTVYNDNEKQSRKLEKARAVYGFKKNSDKLVQKTISRKTQNTRWITRNYRKDVEEKPGKENKESRNVNSPGTMSSLKRQKGKIGRSENPSGYTNNVLQVSSPHSTNSGAGYAGGLDLFDEDFTLS